ncbi:hypothetical protein OEZ86_003660 [Tetradesmus obliquus]|nr:hypothetical protein OEZ86_003660 [Tetradesmus obliquus]
MWAVREARRAGFADECDGCGPIPYITAAARGLGLCEPAYQSLCAYAPVAGMPTEEQELYTRHAQKVFIRSRLAELVFKGPAVTIAAFALLLQLIALSSSSQLYTPPGAFSSSRTVATLPLVATALSFGVGVLSLAAFCSAYAVSQRQSLWGGAKPVQTRGAAKTAVFAAAAFVHCACSAVCRAAVIASAVASIMLDDNIGRPAFYLVVALLATALLLALLVGSKSTCFAVCGGYVTAQGWPQGYAFFSVPAGLLVALLVVAEVLLFVLLSRAAPKRKYDDDWDDEFIELDPHAGKVPI